MKKSAMIGAWVLATAVAVGIGIGAVQLAGAQVTDTPIQPLSADEVPTQPPPADPASTGEDVPTTVTTTTAESTTTSPSSTQGTTGTVTSVVSATSVPRSTTPSSTSSTTSTPPSTTATTTATTTPQQSEVTVHNLIGGSVSIESSPGVVNLLWATPNAGFTVEVGSSGPSDVSVDFKSSSHESKFDAEWSAGLLDVRIREEAED